jgi:O-methyltransferase
MDDQPTAEQDPITEAIGRMIAGATDFYWNAFVALQVNGISGDYAEFGCHQAGSFLAAYKVMSGLRDQRHMWAFDSWQALPDDHPRDSHPGWDLGVGGVGGVEKFHDACARHGVPRSAYTAVEGYYNDTLPPLGPDGAPDDIALAYIDCDLYSSTVTVLDFLAPRLKHGMIVAFDDWHCWTPTDVSGERMALHEFLAAHPEWVFTRYRDIRWGGLSFVVERADAMTA